MVILLLFLFVCLFVLFFYKVVFLVFINYFSIFNFHFFMFLFIKFQFQGFPITLAVSQLALGGTHA